MALFCLTDFIINLEPSTIEIMAAPYDKKLPVKRGIGKWESRKKGRGRKRYAKLERGR